MKSREKTLWGAEAVQVKDLHGGGDSENGLAQEESSNWGQENLLLLASGQKLLPEGGTLCLAPAALSPEPRARFTEPTRRQNQRSGIWSCSAEAARSACGSCRAPAGRLEPPERTLLSTSDKAVGKLLLQRDGC